MPVKPVKSVVRASSGSLLVIGASTGGPRALHTLVAGLGQGLDIPGVIVQHMPPGFTQSLAKRLDAAGGPTVREAVDGESLEAGTILVAPGGYHLVVRPDATVQLSSEPPIHGVRPSIDVTLDSVARSFGRRSIAVLLTGMGKDGARGLKLLRDMGARTFAESESSCVVYGMPKAAFEMHAVETMLPIDEMAPAIIAAATQPMDAAA
jgi:two-component system chemotaxis response regulator CheB